jgi:Pyrimidine dimer DNA glycosylase
MFMRLWSLHPSLLDARGLVSLWREGLLALKVLQGRTKGYTNHPQLERFRACSDPVAAITAYLCHVYEESVRRGYSFNKEKISSSDHSGAISVTDGQLDYEFNHLKQKCSVRSPEHYAFLLTCKPVAHPLFIVTKGGIEPWEKVAGE